MTSPGLLLRMGFDPRRWQTPPRVRPITANVDALLAENEALRQEVWALRQQLEGLHRQAASQAASRVSRTTSPGLTADQLERWCQAMARHPAWSALRLGPPGGLRGLVDALRRHWWNPALSLEEELNRQSPGLGTALSQALLGPHSRGRWAVRAAFALYGARAVEWLNEDPLRVVEELGRRVEQLDHRQGQESQHRQGQGREARQRRRGTRTANNSQPPGGASNHGSSNQRASNQRSSNQRSSNQGASTNGSSANGAGARSGARSESRAGTDAGPRAQALTLLGLEPGATPEAIKRAYRRLAKAHHPDLGGDAEAFRRLEAAYRSLLA